MFKQNLMLWLRSLSLQKIPTTINILGLALGFTCVILVVLFIRDEMRYDSFHKNTNHIYRIVKETHRPEGNPQFSERTSPALASAMQEAFPEVLSATSLGLNNNWIQYQDRILCPETCFTNPEFWNTFSFPFLKGNPQTAFKDPYAVVITQSLAQKLFDDQDPMGKIISVKDAGQTAEYHVTGILANIKNSHFRSEMFLQHHPNADQSHLWNFGSTGARVRTFIQVQPGTSPEELESKIHNLIRPHAGTETAQSLRYHLQPLKQIYLQTLRGNLNKRVTHMSRLAFIALLILAIACANFTNLSTAISQRRSKEIGLKKVLGSSKNLLIQQFLGEAILLALCALLLSLALTHLALPSFNAFMGKNLTLWSPENIYLITALALATTFIGLLAGLYPAFFLSSFKPVETMKGHTSNTSKHTYFKRGIVVCQFATAALMIIATIVIDQQIRYVNNKDLGYATNGIILNGLFWVDRPLEKRREQIKQSYLENPHILKATALDGAIMGFNSGWLRHVRPQSDTNRQIEARLLGIEEDFLNFFDIPIVQGRAFSKNIISDETNAIIVNETAVQIFGWKNAIGKTVQFEGRTGTVVGVVQDFHIRALREQIPPVILYKRTSRFSFMAVKVHPDHLSEVIPFLKTKWQELIPNRPADLQFLDDRISAQYREEIKLGQLFRFFTFLAIFVSSIGLFALSSFMITQRTKEIGIRKVLGASVPNVVFLLSKQFLKLALLSNVIAWPIAYYLLHDWLHHFAYRIPLNITAFALGGILTLLIAFITISYQAIKSATANPIDALRYE